MYTHVLFECVCTVVSPTHCMHENLCSNCWIKTHNQHLFKKEERKKNMSTQISAIMFNVKGWWSWNSISQRVELCACGGWLDPRFFPK